MAKYTNITHIPGLIRINLPNGQTRDFKSSEEALKFFEENYGKGHAMLIISDKPKETELPEVTVTATAPSKPTSSSGDPIRDGIFEGRYKGKSFTPTEKNIKHYLDIYNADKRVSEGYGDKAWGKLFGTHLLAGAGIAAGMTAPAWAPAAGHWLMNTGAPLVAKHVIAPTAAGMIWDESQRALTGTTTTEQVSNWLQEKKGWNPMLADMAGGLTNPGYWINFGGTGQYTRPLFNKIGLGLQLAGKLELSPTLQANVNAALPKSKLLTKVIDPAMKFVDRNLYKGQAVLSPWLLRHTPTTILSSDLPRFKFVKNASELQNPSLLDGKVIDYMLFNSAKNNEKVFGNAMRLKTPDINSTFYKEGLLSGGAALDQVLSSVGAGVAATDLAFFNQDDRNPWVRGLEYGLIGRWGLNKFLRGRGAKAINDTKDYIKNIYQLDNKLSSFFRRSPKIRPTGYNTFWDGERFSYVDPAFHEEQIKPGFNYKNATFDDLVGFLLKNEPRNSYLKGYSVDSGRLYTPSGLAIAEKGQDGKINLINETELRNILARNIDIADYATGKRYTGKIQVGDDGTVTIPLEYTNTLRNNINYVLNVLFPGSGVKVFGSSAGVTEAGFPHATHDIDFYITLNEIDKLLKKGVLSESDRINPGTYTYKHNPSLLGEQGNVDLNVIEQTPEGRATGIRAEELYRQYFPDDYFLALREFKARQSNGESNVSLQINKTPEELLEAVNPSSKTIMDSFDIDYTLPAKGKHALRSWAHLVYSDPTQVSKGLNQYAQSMLGSRVQLFPATVDLLGNKELNLQALKKLGVNLRDFELDRIASDPQRMKNVLDSWYLMDNTAMRYIRGTWPGTTGHSSENFIKSATTWDPIHNGGNDNGVGLNVTVGGDSHHGGDLKAFISPKTQYKSTNLLDLIDEITNNFGGNLEASSLLRGAAYGTPEQQVQNLQRVYNERGWNFLLNGSTYVRGKYASATRPFDINLDYVGFTPVSTVMNPMVPRISILEENNPLARGGLDNPFTSRRKIQARLDPYHAKISALAPIFQANQSRNYMIVNPVSRMSADVMPWKQEAFMAGVSPTLVGVGLGITSYMDLRRKNWVNGVTSEPDEIVRRMPEEDRKKFTKEGVDSLRQYYHTSPMFSESSEDDINHYIYWDLKEIYDKHREQQNK